MVQTNGLPRIVQLLSLSIAPHFRISRPSPPRDNLQGGEDVTSNGRGVKNRSPSRSHWTERRERWRTNISLIEEALPHAFKNTRARTRILTIRTEDRITWLKVPMPQLRVQAFGILLPSLMVFIDKETGYWHTLPATCHLWGIHPGTKSSRIEHGCVRVV